jgi:hypothetical protein
MSGQKNLSYLKCRITKAADSQGSPSAYAIIKVKRIVAQSDIVVNCGWRVRRGRLIVIFYFDPGTIFLLRIWVLLCIPYSSGAD